MVIVCPPGVDAVISRSLFVGVRSKTRRGLLMSHSSSYSALA